MSFWFWLGGILLVMKLAGLLKTASIYRRNILCRINLLHQFVPYASLIKTCQFCDSCNFTGASVIKLFTAVINYFIVFDIVCDLLTSVKLILWAASKWNNDVVQISLLRSMIRWKCTTGFLYQTNEAGERARQPRDRKRERETEHSLKWEIASAMK